MIKQLTRLAQRHVCKIRAWLRQGTAYERPEHSAQPPSQAHVAEHLALHTCSQKDRCSLPAISSSSGHWLQQQAATGQDRCSSLKHASCCWAQRCTLLAANPVGEGFFIHCRYSGSTKCTQKHSFSGQQPAPETRSSWVAQTGVPLTLGRTLAAEAGGSPITSSWLFSRPESFWSVLFTTSIHRLLAYDPHNWKPV